MRSSVCGWLQFSTYLTVKLKNPTRKSDRGLLIAVLVLTIVGLIAITNSSGPFAFRYFEDRFYFLKNQLPVAIGGFILMLVISRISYKFWEKFAVVLFFLNVILLVLVFVPGLGARYLGASRWIDLGFTHLQPSEFLKITISIYLAKVAAKGKGMTSFIAPLIVSVILVMLQPDLGTTLIIGSIAMIQMFVSGVRILPFISIGTLAVIFGYLLIITSEYRKNRLESYLAIIKDPMAGSYHVKQVLIALGSGGLLGVGLGESKQKHMFLPETATDSIFPIIAEEIGFIGASLLILLICFYVYRGLLISKRAPDKFSQILSMGLVSWIAFQSLFNLGSMVALIPITGVPLPFISYGGTSLLCVMIASGILLSISRDSSISKS